LAIKTSTSIPTRNFRENISLRGNDEQKVRAVFVYELLALFETEEGVSVEADGDRLIF